MKSHYWLIAGQVLFTIGENTLNRSLNTLVTTKNPFLTRSDMGKAQQAIQVRLMRETFPENEIPADLKIHDVFIASASSLGAMTPEEFNAGYDDLLKEQAAAKASERPINEVIRGGI
jgi:hypothetical protein